MFLVVNNGKISAAGAARSGGKRGESRRELRAGLAANIENIFQMCE